MFRCKNFSLALVFLLFGLLSPAQNYQFGGGLTNNVTAWPVIGFPQLFYTRLHPGADIMLEKKLNTKVRNQFWGEANIGFFYHRFFQTAVKLNGVFHYRYFFSPRFFGDIGIGGGYLHSFYHYQVFKLNSNGYYVKESGFKGRPQFMFGAVFGAGFGLKKSDPDKWRLLIQFKSNMQGIFSGSFVPVVPYNVFLLGISHRINLKKKENKNEKDK